MSDRTRIFTRDILNLRKSLEKGRDEFIETFNEVSSRLHNCSCGDSFLSEAAKKIYCQAIEKFIIND